MTRCGAANINKMTKLTVMVWFVIKFVSASFSSSSDLISKADVASSIINMEEFRYIALAIANLWANNTLEIKRSS
jgi:hypothetical protein